MTIASAAQLLGTWKLLSIEDTVGGKVQPSKQFGAHPQGFLLYQPDGYMSATIVNGDRPGWKDSVNPTEEEKIAYFETLAAYCGTYEVDPEQSVVTHYPSVAWTPEFVGSVQPRPFRIERDHLIITVTMVDATLEKRVLTWVRATSSDARSASQ